MTEFYLLLLLLSVLMLGSLVLFWLSFSRASTKTSTANSVNQRASDNLDWLEQRNRELALQFEDGQIEQSVYQQLKNEAKAQLLQSTQTINKSASVKPSKPQGFETGIIIVSGIAVLLIAASLYFSWGLSLGTEDQFQIRQQLLKLQNTKHNEQTLDDINALKNRLKTYASGVNPDEELLGLLAEAYRGSGEYLKSAEVFAQLLQREPESPGLMTARAEALYLAQLRNPNANSASSIGEVPELLAAALQLQPENAKALGLSGIVAFQSGNWQLAINYWRRAEALYPAHSEELKTIKGGIRAAQEKLGISDSAKVQAPITAAIKLSITANIPATVSVEPSTPVFVFASAVSGPRMPLAAKKLRYDELPTEITLSNTDAMTAASIEGHSEIKVTARLALSGQPLAKPGDYQSNEAVLPVFQFDAAMSEEQVKQQISEQIPVTLSIRNEVAN